MHAQTCLHVCVCVHKVRPGDMEEVVGGRLERCKPLGEAVRLGDSGDKVSHTLVAVL